MNKEEFYKVWKDSSREDILNQYYYDYRYQRELVNDINKAIEYIEDRFVIDKQTGGYHLTHTFDSSNLCELYDILKGSDSNEY